MMILQAQAILDSKCDKLFSKYTMGHNIEKVKVSILFIFIC